MTRRRVTRAAAVLAASIVTIGGLPGLASAPVTLNETGSTLMYPLFREWAAAYHKAAPSVRLTTAGTGSTAGVAAAVSGAAQIGASDAYMSDEEVDKNPSIINIPLAIAAQTVNANLPGMAQAKLRLSGPAIADIYLGKVTQWDDREIADLNPGVKLPHHAIVPIHRSDGSGDTFMFTQFLTFSTKAWEDGPNYGTTLDWPEVSGAISAVGNPGMIAAAKAHPYSIAYIGTSFAREIRAAGLVTAELQNQDGNFVLPTPATVLAGASTLDPRTPKDERLTLVFAPGANSYPIVSYEYAIVSTRQPNAATAAALRDFLTWVIDERGGNAPDALEPLNFIPLPELVRALSLDQIAKIQP
jgi:phosphate transport system substrate-binding protein